MDFIFKMFFRYKPHNLTNNNRANIENKEKDII